LGEPDHVISYTYDAVGNRLTKTDCTDARPCVSTTYQYDDNNRLIQEDDITYSYDHNGNLREKTSAEENIAYFYDSENRLIRVETTRFGVTIVVEYEYDAEGNRVRKIIDGTIVITYLVDANRNYAQVLEECDGNGNLLVRYAYGHDLISQTRGGATSYYHYDGLGSTRALTNSAEAVTDTYNYDAFGNLLDKTGVTVNTYLYTGEFFDANTGFYYLRARYLNPAIGRFVTMDAFAGRNRDPYTLHKYLYAHASPVNNIDPSGNMSLVNVLVTTAVVGVVATIPVDYFYRGHLWGVGSPEAVLKKQQQHISQKAIQYNIPSYILEGVVREEMKAIALGEWWFDLGFTFVPFGIPKISNPSVGIGQVRLETAIKDAEGYQQYGYLRQIRIGLKLFWNKEYAIEVTAKYLQWLYRWSTQKGKKYANTKDLWKFVVAAYKGNHGVHKSRTDIKALGIDYTKYSNVENYFVQIDKSHIKRKEFVRNVFGNQF